MPTDYISYQESNYFIKIVTDYLDQVPKLQPFYNRFPTLENFSEQIREKELNYNQDNRAILVNVLLKQYSNIEPSDLTSKNINLLAKNSTFTITTGHQLNLFTGPLYFLYKIISTINLCKQLKTEYPKNDFVPIYWMATEDHDFDEINYFNFQSIKIRWAKQNPSGPVGRFPTDDLKIVYEVIEKKLGSSENAIYLKKLFSKAYLNNHNLADATRCLANELFKNEGLVIIDADNASLKKIFTPYIRNELIDQQAFKQVNQTISQLKGYDIQVNPREINLFYILDNLRERIVFENDVYKINNTQIQFTETQILDELKNHPERFSPNVILRPLYQEVILPNLCYIGGGGEIAYWLQLQATFNIYQVAFPILLLRNSVLILDKKQSSKADKLALSYKDLFADQNQLLKNKTIAKSSITINLEAQKATLKKQFEYLYQIALATDKSFIGAVKAQETKQIKGLENLERRLLKAQKRVLKDYLDRIVDLQNQLFPNQSLQERQLNFSELYLDHGDLLIKKLLATLKPLENEFNAIVLE